MAAITDPEAVAFCNSRLRPAFDRFAQLYYEAKSLRQEWDANSLGTLIAYDNADLVVDGSAQDGRHPLSGIDVNNFVTRLSDLITDMEANNNAKLNTVLAGATNPQR